MKISKSTLYSFEQISAGIFLIAVVMKFCRFNFVNSELILSVGMLAVIYIFSSVYFWFLKPITAIMYFFIRLSGIALAVCLTGILFKLMCWEGNIQMIVGIVSCTIALAFSFIVKPTANEMPETNRYKIRIIVILSFAIVLSFITKKELFGHYNIDDKECVRLYNQMIDNPKNIEYKQAFQKYMEEKRKREN